MIKTKRNINKDNHFVSVIIPTIGRPELKLCREALELQTRKPDEIIIVEDKKRKGSSWARNQGIERSRGKLIAFMDDDCVPPPRWLELLIDAIDRHGADGAGGTYEEADSFLSEARKRRGFPRQEQIDIEGWVGTGGNVMYTKECLLSCLKNDGYFFDDSSRFSGDDLDLAWRIRHYGGKLVFVPVNVVHLKRLNWWGYFLYQFQRGRVIAAIYRKYRQIKSEKNINRSLLWGGKQNLAMRLIKIFWYKIIGPLDIRSFSRFDYFLRFWFGEKVQGLGFLWGFIKGH